MAKIHLLILYNQVIETQYIRCGKEVERIISLLDDGDYDPNKLKRDIEKGLEECANSSDLNVLAITNDFEKLLEDFYNLQRAKNEMNFLNSRFD